MAGGERTPTVVAVVDRGRELASWHLTTPGRPDLAAVEVLAVVELAARRRGWVLELRSSCPLLLELLELVGLAGLFDRPAGSGAGACRCLEPGGQPEGGEELRVEEVVEPGDAAV